MTQQHPIGTGFTAASTADDILRGIDLSGRHVVVTGGHSGIGLETTRALSKAGAAVVVGARTPDRAAVALAGIERVEVVQLDLADPASIDAFSGRYLESGRPATGSPTSAGTTRTSPPATTRCSPTASPRPPMCCSPSSWTACGPTRASAGTPYTPASS
ncbi:SDR family NAD(P)-dependent oxidoreductase [Kribbella sp. NPDC049174]|uniref:SDR family NAD(P)-dependent oxidoreductase n=1 Tax=Kribbella sp. NPDC049174 TaxID=3364112 RepID=UPI00371CCD11